MDTLMGRRAFLEALDMAKITWQQSSSRRITPLFLTAVLQSGMLAGSGLSLLPLSATAATGVRDYQISAGPLSNVLARFAATAGVQLVFDPTLLTGRTSPGLQGRFTLDQGFERLLRGSGYRWSERGAGIYALEEGSADAALAMPETTIQASAEGGGADAGYQRPVSASTTRLGLTDRQTPQAITTLTRDQVEDFRLQSIKEALRAAPSVTVEQTETDRTEFTSRGFDINTFQYDGVGMPFVGTVLVGDQDLAEYEQVDVLHGANGLMSGTGNPSAAVNFVRKRPTADAQARLGVSVGSWDSRRVDADVSGPLTETGNVRGRFIYAHDKGNSWLDRYSHEKNVAAGLVAFDLSDADTLTLGFSQHNSDANGSSWGNLPLADVDGNPIHYHSRSASIGQDWTYWNLDTQRLFGEFAHDFGNGWKGTLTATGVTERQDTNMFYVFGVSGDDATAFPSHTTSKAHQLVGEAKLSGPFQLFGREHELTVGASYGRTHQKLHEYDFAENGYYGTTLSSVLAGTPEPSLEYSSDATQQNFIDRQKSLYAGVRFNVVDDLHWIVGARMLSADGSGSSYGDDYYTRVHGEVTPYTGLVYDLSKQWSLYASWTKIFSPQHSFGLDGRLLDPLEGKSMEAGVKGGLFDDRLSLTAAVFKTEQRNVMSTSIFSGSRYLYDTTDYHSHGVELQASGEALPGLELLAGYTYTRIDDEDGDRARKFVPSHSLRGLATYRLPGLPQAKVGARLRWQSGIENDDNSRIRQNAYALVDVLGSYDFDEHWSTQLNLNNLTDRKYLLSLYNNATSGNYGAPRNATLSVSYNF
ncbi:TonB-dependent siderophore receptor [Pseudomonas oryzihabitans]|uniref:TonB-dependent siderophore receptor n=1 Tax=Pseudomonas oryzihabitans TaxID=47885 RepID=UPI0028955D42|nr:TonB-dependent siderophore receptor [Pseudomonas oryzihabitans]MDT3723114.1 TonB-dependent siderophore receptor [Pseudomonas oryzihabitans]